MTGTDTGVGKTAIACGILATLRRDGVRVAAMKPAESGHRIRNGSWPPDGRALAAAAGHRGAREDVVPYVFADPLAPLVASRRARVPIDLRRLDSAYGRLREAHDLTVVEGAGGLAVPVTEETTMADLAVRWKLPLLIVARPGLGTLNHTALTIEYARARGLRVLGVVLNGWPERPGLAERTNPQVLEAMTGVPVLGKVPRLRGVDVDAGRLSPIASAVARRVDLGPVRALVEVLA